MISITRTQKSLDQLGMMKYFPTKASVVAEIGQLLDHLCENDGEAQRLTAAIVEEFSEWPGPRGLQQLFAAQIAPSRPARPSSTGCSQCIPELPGWCMVVRVLDAAWDKTIERAFPANVYDTDRLQHELEEKYKDTNYHVDHATTYCACPAGQHLREALR